MAVSMLAFAAVDAHAECAPARTSQSSLPKPWARALDELSRSTSEPGHPWSCVGGTLELELEGKGATLRVGREGEDPITRHVDRPEDLVPLGQAVLANPLARVESPPVPAVEAPTEPFAPPPPVERPADVAPPSPATPTPPSMHVPRLMLGANLDSRGVGNSGIAWMGPAVSASVPMGRWLPTISARYQGTLASRSPLDEGSVALSLQVRFPIHSFEVRTGVVVRGAAVIRDLPRPQGEQSQLQFRAGGMVSIMIPVFSWAHVVAGIDGDVVALSRETAGPVEATGTVLTPFPTFTLGGTLGFEVPL